MKVVKNDITKLDVSIVVNAANPGLSGGSGVDGAIHEAAGKELYGACAVLGGCAVGDAKMTDGFHLRAKKIIHAVGPVYREYEEETAEDLLRKCYGKCMQLVSEYRKEYALPEVSVAFPCIATGVYGFPNDKAAAIAIGTVDDFLKKNHLESLVKVIFCCYKKEDYDLYQTIMEEQCLLEEEEMESDVECHSVFDLLELYFKERKTGVVLRDVPYYRNKKRVVMPLVLLHENGVFFINQLVFEKEEEFEKDCVNFLVTFLSELDLPMKSYFYFGIKNAYDLGSLEELEGAEMFLYEGGTRRVRGVMSMFDYIDEIVTYNQPVMDISTFVKVKNWFKEKSGIVNQEMRDENGNVYIRKRKGWAAVVDVDADAFFYKSLFGGVIGIHKFLMKQWLMGVVYLFTLGLFGFGWFFDCLFMIFGFYRVNKREWNWFWARKVSSCYIPKVKNPVGKLILLLIVASIVFIVIIYLFKLILMGSAALGSFMAGNVK